MGSEAFRNYRPLLTLVPLNMATGILTQATLCSSWPRRGLGSRAVRGSSSLIPGPGARTTQGRGSRLRQPLASGWPMEVNIWSWAGLAGKVASPLPGWVALRRRFHLSDLSLHICKMGPYLPPPSRGFASTRENTCKMPPPSRGSENSGLGDRDLWSSAERPGVLGTPMGLAEHRG